MPCSVGQQILECGGLAAAFTVPALPPKSPTEGAAFSRLC